MNSEELSLLTFWLALVPAAALAVPILHALVKLKSRQNVSEFIPEHKKKQGTPTMGGLIVAAGVLAASIFLALSHHISGLTDYLILFFGFAVIGFVDDYVVPRVVPSKRGLGWIPKIAMQLVVAAVPFLLGGANLVELLTGILCVLFFSNAYNFTDGLDALAGSVGIFLLAGLAMIGTLAGASPAVEIFAACLVGGLIPFMVLNAPPARLFMGDLGALAIGSSIGMMFWTIADQAGQNGLPGYTWVALFVLSLLMCAELLPVPIQIASVKLLKRRMFTRTPIHHGFEVHRWPETRIVWRFAMVQLVLVMIALSVMIFGAHQAVQVVALGGS